MELAKFKELSQYLIHMSYDVVDLDQEDYIKQLNYMMANHQLGGMEPDQIRTLQSTANLLLNLKSSLISQGVHRHD